MRRLAWNCGYSGFASGSDPLCGVKLVLNDWTDHARTEDSGTLDLAAGREVGLVLEYCENLAGAMAYLCWSAPGLPRETVPASHPAPAPR